MICVKSLHLRLNQILLFAVGLWPYRRSNLIRLQLGLFYCILITFIIFQFMTIATADSNPQLVIEVFSTAIFFVISAIKYSMFCFKMDVVKQLLEILQHIYDKLKDENEVEIIRRYGGIAKRYTSALILLFMCTISSLGFLELRFCILRDVSSVNKSESCNVLPIRIEYFVDQEKYFNLIIIYMNTAIIIGAFALIATGTMILVFFHYACGMFEIASYRIEKAINFTPLRTNSTKNANLAYKRIVYAVDIHRDSMEFIKFYLSSFNIFYLLLLAAAIISLTLNMFRVLQEISSGHDFKDMIWPAAFLLGIYIYVLFANDCSQRIIDHNENLYITVYNTKWYTAPLNIQKLALFLLQRGAKAFKVTIGGLFEASFEGLATMTSASFTYCTVLYSTKQF